MNSWWNLVSYWIQMWMSVNSLPNCKTCPLWSSSRVLPFHHFTPSIVWATVVTRNTFECHSRTPWKNGSVCVCALSCDPMDCSKPAPLSMKFSGQDYLNGLPFPAPGDLPNLGIELAFQADSLSSEPQGSPKKEYFLLDTKLRVNFKKYDHPNIIKLFSQKPVSFLSPCLSHLCLHLSPHTPGFLYIFILNCLLPPCSSLTHHLRLRVLIH